jgi:ORF6N domain-containing protein
MTALRRRSLVRFESVVRRIHVIRGEKVMLDSDLALLYGVALKRLNEQVKRNRRRFPSDFMFQLSAHEARVLRSQFATLEHGRGRHRKYTPHVFTEHGAVMLASVLSSPIAISASIEVVRAFVRHRAATAAHGELARQLDALEEKCDRRFRAVFETLRQLIEPPRRAPRRIGFRHGKDDQR